MGWQDAPLADEAAGGGQPKWAAAPVVKYDIDWNKPDAEIRAEIGKLPEEERQSATRQWADAYIAKERKGIEAKDVPGTVNPFRLGDVVRNTARGTIAGSYLDEGLAAVQHMLNNALGGKFGSTYDEAIEFQRARNRALDAEGARAVIPQLIGAFGTGAPIAKAVMGPKEASLFLRKIPGGVAAGGTAGYVSGIGEGEGDIGQRHEHATSGEDRLFGLSPTEGGAVLGGFLPPTLKGGAIVTRAVHDAASPALARAAETIRTLPERIGIGKLSADGSTIETAGSRAAAEQMLANQLAREGKTTQDVRDILAKAEESRRLDSNSYAPDVTALGELSPGWQRMAGSAARASPEAGNTASAFFKGKQTGVAPDEGPNALARAGIPTRERFSRPITGEEAQGKFGTSFGTPQEGEVPMGQGERLLDSFKRALRIKDAELHGHEANAYRTDAAILDAAKSEAKPAYEAVYKAGGNINVAPAIEPVLAKWSIDGPRLANEAEDVKMLVQKMAKAYAPGGRPITNIEKFDKTKQYLDDKIGAYFESSNDRNRYVGGILNEFKNDLLKAVDGIQANGLGAQYAAARGLYSSRMESRRALQAGKDAWRDDSDIGIDAYRALTGGKEGDKKLFRLGLWSGASDKIKRMDANADKTRIFRNKNIEELLTEVIPRTETEGGKAKGVFGNRPERFGGYLKGEERAVEARQEILGNSKTAQRLKDDEAYQAMSKIGETIEKFKNSASMSMLAIRWTADKLTSLFGMRADTAASIAKMLFTANPHERERVLRAVEARLGANRAEQFARLMEQYHGEVASAAAKQGGKSQLPSTE